MSIFENDTVKSDCHVQIFRDIEKKALKMTSSFSELFFSYPPP